MNLFFSKNIDKDLNKIILDGQEHLHLIKVLRKSIDDNINVTDGLGFIYLCKITNIHKTYSELTINEINNDNSHKPILNLAVSILKKSNRFEFLLEKAVEIGVSEITPIISKHTEKKKLNFERLNKIMLSALKQSKSSILPKLNNTIEVKHYIDNTSSSYSNYVATCKNNQTKSIKSVLKPNLNVNILIGPEGDFSHDELIYAKNANFTPVSFSNKRLRSETAAIYFCTLFSYINKL